MLRKRKDISEGQSIMEFTFCMIVVLIMLYSTAMVFRWTGMDLAERRIAYERSSSFNIVEDYGVTCLLYNEENPQGCIKPPLSCGGLTLPPCCDCLKRSKKEDGPLQQMGSFFYEPVRMNAVWGDEYK